MQPANLFATVAPTTAPGQAQGAGLGAAGSMGGLFGPVEGQGAEGADASGFAEALMAALMAGQPQTPQPQTPQVNVDTAPQGDQAVGEAKAVLGACAPFGGMPVAGPVIDASSGLDAPAPDAASVQVAPGGLPALAEPADEADRTARPATAPDGKAEAELPQAAASLKDSVRAIGRDVTASPAPTAAATTIPAPLQVALLEAGPRATEAAAPTPTDAETPPPVAVQQAIIAETQKPVIPVRPEPSKAAARDRTDSAPGVVVTDNEPQADIALAAKAGTEAKNTPTTDAFASGEAGDDTLAATDTAEPTANPLPTPTARAAESAPGFAEAAKVNTQTVAHLSAQIAKAAENGRSTRFDVQLEPYGLGKVDVRVEINKAGDITADLRFDNPIAAADLKSRSGELAAALENAGFDPAKTQLSFSSNGQQNFAGQFGQDLWNQQQGQGRQGFSGRAFTDLADLADSPAAPTARQGRTGGVDVRI